MALQCKDRDFKNLLGIFCVLLEKDGDLSTTGVVHVSRVFMNSVDSLNGEQTQEIFSDLMENGLNLNEYCNSLKCNLDADEKTEVFLEIMSLACKEGVLEKRMPVIDEIASRLDIEKSEKDKIKLVFEKKYEKLAKEENWLSIGGYESSAEIKIVGFHGQFAAGKVSSMKKLVILNCESICFQDGSRVNDYDVLDYNEDNPLVLFGTSHVFSVDVFDNLLENKSKIKPITCHAVFENGRIEKREKLSGHLVASFVMSRSSILVEHHDMNFPILISGRKVEEKSFSAYQGETISFDLHGKEVIFDLHSNINRPQIFEQHLRLRDYHESFSEDALLVLQKSSVSALAYIFGTEKEIFLNGVKVENSFPVEDFDVIRMGHLIIQIRMVDKGIKAHARVNPIQNLYIRDVSVRFPGVSSYALKGIRFFLETGALAAILGPAGSGKSTLLNTILGQLQPVDGDVRINGIVTRRGLRDVKKHFGFVPQDDLLVGELTVAENLYYQYKFLKPGLDEEEIELQIDRLLKEVGLQDKKYSRVGSIDNRTLSGGERRRMNIAMELISDPAVLVLDEPTSGLSSYDAERIVSLLKKLANNGKIVLAVIHQPSSTVYDMFNVAIILNKGGKKAYSGSHREALRIFNEAINGTPQEKKYIECPECKNLNIDVLMRSLGSWSANFWEAVRVFSDSAVHKKDFRQRSLQGSSKTLPLGETFNWKERATKFFFLFKRTVVVKLRDRINMFVTLFVAPILSLLASFCLRSHDGEYRFSDNDQYATFLFIMVISSIFLGLSNSVTEIIKDRTILKRESLHGQSMAVYLLSKFVVLLIFSLIQSVLFVVPAHWVLQEHDMILVHIALMTLITATGVSAGMVCSCFTRSMVAAYNLIPLILVPQILLGGGFLDYASMNPAMGVEGKSGGVPILAQLTFSRWGSEMIVTANHDLHPVMPEIGKMRDRESREREDVQQRYQDGKISRGQRNELRKKMKVQYSTFYESRSDKYNHDLQTFATKSAGEFGSPVNLLGKSLWKGTFLEAAFSRTWFRNAFILSMFIILFLGICVFRLSYLQLRSKF